MTDLPLCDTCINTEEPHFSQIDERISYIYICRKYKRVISNTTLKKYHTKVNGRIWTRLPTIKKCKYYLCKGVYDI